MPEHSHRKMDNQKITSYRILLADDHNIFRRGLKKLIEEMEDLDVIGEAGDGLELLDLLRELKPDMVILDISMPNLRGIETTREIKMLYPQMKVLILTMHKNREYLYHAISAGAHGYLLKEDSDMELFSAVQTIRTGGSYITTHLSGEVAEDLAQVYLGKGRLPTEPLTIRESEVLKLIAEGKTNREVAKLLHISVRTVENHRANLTRKLKIRKTADLVRYAIQKGIISKFQ